MIALSDEQRYTFVTFLESLTPLELVQLHRDARMQHDELTLHLVSEVMSGRVINGRWLLEKQRERDKAAT